MQIDSIYSLYNDPVTEPIIGRIILIKNLMVQVESFFDRRCGNCL